MAEETAQPKPAFVRDEDFASLYANHVWYELSVWDLKLIFGETDQLQGPGTIVQHTSVSVSWLQAKLMAYFLQVNLAIYENQNGPIRIPNAVLPPPPPATEAVEDETARAEARKIADIYQRLIGAA
jgi:hypothetical protein